MSSAISCIPVRASASSDRTFSRTSSTLFRSICTISLSCFASSSFAINASLRSRKSSFMLSQNFSINSGIFASTLSKKASLISGVAFRSPGIHALFSGSVRSRLAKCVSVPGAASSFACRSIGIRRSGSCTSKKPLTRPESSITQVVLYGRSSPFNFASKVTRLVTPNRMPSNFML